MIYMYFVAVTDKSNDDIIVSVDASFNFDVTDMFTLLPFNIDTID